MGAFHQRVPAASTPTDPVPCQAVRYSHQIKCAARPPATKQPSQWAAAQTAPLTRSPCAICAASRSRSASAAMPGKPPPPHIYSCFTARRLSRVGGQPFGRTTNVLPIGGSIPAAAAGAATHAPCGMQRPHPSSRLRGGRGERRWAGGVAVFTLLRASDALLQLLGLARAPLQLVLQPLAVHPRALLRRTALHTPANARRPTHMPPRAQTPMGVRPAAAPRPPPRSRARAPPSGRPPPSRAPAGNGQGSRTPGSGRLRVAGSRRHVGALIPLEHARHHPRYLPEARLLVRAGAYGGGLDDRASTRSPDRLLARWRPRQRRRGGRCHGRGSDKEGSHHRGNQGAIAPS
eukprot:COSAG01_NODE_1724_length_9382_cov_6.435743_7_plen_347_part_00